MGTFKCIHKGHYKDLKPRGTDPGRLLNVDGDHEYSEDEVNEIGVGLCRSRYRSHIENGHPERNTKKYVRQANRPIVHTTNHTRDDSGPCEYSNDEYEDGVRYRYGFETIVHHDSRKNKKRLVRRCRKRNHGAIVPVYTHPVGAPHVMGTAWDGDYDEDEAIPNDHTYRITYRVHIVVGGGGARDTKRMIDQIITVVRPFDQRSFPSFSRGPIVNQPIRPDLTQTNIIIDANANDGLYKALSLSDPRRWNVNPDQVLRELLQKHLWGESVDNRAMIVQANTNHANDDRRLTALEGTTAGHTISINDITGTRLPNLRTRIHNTRQKLRRELTDADNIVRTDFATADTALDAKITQLRTDVNLLIRNDLVVQYQLANLRAHINNIHELVNRIYAHLTTAGTWADVGANVNFRPLPYTTVQTTHNQIGAHALVALANKAPIADRPWNQLEAFYGAHTPLPIGPPKA
jgi:hypothetical protein